MRLETAERLSDLVSKHAALKDARLQALRNYNHEVADIYIVAMGLIADEIRRITYP